MTNFSYSRFCLILRRDLAEHRRTYLAFFGILVIAHTLIHFFGNLINKLTFTLVKNNMKVSGKGTDKEPYVLNTEFGEGKAFNIKYIFKYTTLVFRLQVKK